MNKIHVAKTLHEVTSDTRGIAEVPRDLLQNTLDTLDALFAFNQVPGDFKELLLPRRW